MSEYLNKDEFDRIFKKQFRIFCEKHDLILYRANSGVSIFLEPATTGGSHLLNAQTAFIDFALYYSLSSPRGYWHQLSLPSEYINSLLAHVYSGFAERPQLDELNKNIAKIVNPQDICEFLKNNTNGELEHFLMHKKSLQSKRWLNADIFSYISPLMVSKNNEQKCHTLQSCLKNNHLDTNTPEFQKRLLNFIHIHIPTGYHTRFSPYLSHTENLHQESLFNIPQTTLILDINKNQLSKCLAIEKKLGCETDVRLKTFFKNLLVSFESKETSGFFNVQSLALSQISQVYKNVRLTIEPISGKLVNQEGIQEYIKLFTDMYVNLKTIPIKKEIINMGQTISLMLKLGDSLEGKESPAKKNYKL